MKYQFFIVFAFVFACISCETNDSDVSVRINDANNLLKAKQNIVQQLNSRNCTYQDLIASIKPYSGVLSNSKKIGCFDFNVRYQHHLLLGIKNNLSIELGDTLDENFLRDLREYSNLHYFTFEFQNTDFKSELIRYELESPQQYSDRIMYYSYYCKKDAFLIENGTDTLAPAFVHFERAFDVSPKIVLTFVFETTNDINVDKLNFVFNDVVFRNGKVNFEFDYQKFSSLNAQEIKKLLL